MITHYVKQDLWITYRVSILCGAEFTDSVTNDTEYVTCEACLKLLRQEREAQLVNELLGGADSV